MEWSTHLLSGIVAGFAATGDWKGALVGGAAGVVSDLDEPRSRFGKLFILISYPVNKLVGHRTFTHSLLFAFLAAVGLSSIVDKWLVQAAVAGILAHIAGDMLTGKVKLFYPFKQSVGVSIPRSSFTVIDRIARMGLILLLIWIVTTNSFI